MLKIVYIPFILFIAQTSAQIAGMETSARNGSTDKDVLKHNSPGDVARLASQDSCETTGERALPCFPHVPLNLSGSGSGNMIHFPAQADWLKFALAAKEPNLIIHIPHKRAWNSPEDYEFTVNSSMHLDHIKSLTIYHSAGMDKGYDSKAVEILMPLITSSGNLEKLIISSVMAKDVFKNIHNWGKIKAFIDFSISYGTEDTFYPPEIIEWNIKSLKYYQEKYHHDINGVIGNLPAASFKGNPLLLFQQSGQH